MCRTSYVHVLFIYQSVVSRLPWIASATPGTHADRAARARGMSQWELC
jgi:hypothetical protein